MSNPIDDNIEQALEEGKEVTPAPPKAKGPSSPQTKSWMKYAVMIVFIVMAALAIGLGAGLPRRNKTNDNTQPSGEAPNLTVEKVRISDSTTRSLSLIDSDTIRNTYADCEDARVDVRKALITMANQTIQEHLKSYYFTGEYDGPVFFGPPEVDFADSDGGDAAVPAPASAPVSQGAAGRGEASGPSVETTEDSFGTNNQVEGVEEPDFVQSDGVSIFAAYGTEVRSLVMGAFLSHIIDWLRLLK